MHARQRVLRCVCTLRRCKVKVRKRSVLLVHARRGGSQRYDEGKLWRGCGEGVNASQEDLRVARQSRTDGAQDELRRTCERSGAEGFYGNEAKDVIDVKKEVAEVEREVENSTNMREATEFLKLSDPLLTGGDTALATHIQWRGKQFKVYGEYGMRTYGAVHKILNRLKNEASTLSVDKTLTLYKKLFVHIEETKKHLSKACRDAESMSFGSEYDEEDLAQLRLSTQALDVLVLEKEIARDLFLAEQLGAKLFDKSATMKHKSDRN